MKIDDYTRSARTRRRIAYGSVTPAQPVPLFLAARSNVRRLVGCAAGRRPAVQVDLSSKECPLSAQRLSQQLGQETLLHPVHRRLHLFNLLRMEMIIIPKPNSGINIRRVSRSVEVIRRIDAGEARIISSISILCILLAAARAGPR